MKTVAIFTGRQINPWSLWFSGKTLDTANIHTRSSKTNGSHTADALNGRSIALALFTYVAKWFVCNSLIPCLGRRWSQIAKTRYPTLEESCESTTFLRRPKPWRSFLTDFCTSSRGLNHIVAKVSLSTWFPQLFSSIRRCPYSWFYFLHKKPNECSLFYLKKSEGLIHGVNLLEIPLDCSEISLVCDTRSYCQDKSCISE